MDALLAETDKQEAYSLAYVCAVAASAGYVVATRHFDRDSIDLTIEAGESMRPKIDIQVKATINLDGDGSVFRYKLKQKNYDDLRIERYCPESFALLIRRRLRFQRVVADRAVACSCSIWSTTPFRQCAAAGPPPS
ncbi:MULTISPECIES: DUF4365 domain-containing protein [Bradyrhizobium]|uniref:DUF4365 domain-containing protein n=6 Tax=Bradyrhizobium TaxID=374 RepID=A0A7Z0QM74_9BRAD|nr:MULTISPECIES: DUF4365 domain-containing protein [Bradyrhizobium]WLC03552.1 DUF4365 domain-containing protein [Bradyrhizobium japonicum USDA 123]BAR63215.1 putative uncharacterized protein [Bradyrhizobium diazoefficiens]MBR0884271.1 DUF4365 domain-containing protein [Bradyrhizobium liaoningense]MBR0948017.1 DUF4365 domain-containing protein [Bradyrhizobium liaoningense]MBR1004500.1 DUF4365 domain-containing protein [Bradyrhizobium liaoningense]